MHGEGAPFPYYVSADFYTIHSRFRAPLALPIGDHRRIPALTEAINGLTTPQRKRLIDRLLADDLISNYRLIYDPTFPLTTLRQE